MRCSGEYVAEDPLNFTGQYQGSDTVPADAPFAEDKYEEVTYRPYSLEALGGGSQAP